MLWGWLGFSVLPLVFLKCISREDGECFAYQLIHNKQSQCLVPPNNTNLLFFIALRACWGSLLLLWSCLMLARPGNPKLPHSVASGCKLTWGFGIWLPYVCCSVKLLGLPHSMVAGFQGGVFPTQKQMPKLLRPFLEFPWVTSADSFHQNQFQRPDQIRGKGNWIFMASSLWQLQIVGGDRVWMSRQ